MLALGWAGLLPFAGCALLAWQPGLASLDPARVLNAYGLAIVCFLSGTLWGTAADWTGPGKGLRLIMSNLLVLVATAGVLFADAEGSVLILMLVFWLVMAFEWISSVDHGWYMRYRLQLTSVVTLLLLVYLAAPPLQ